MTRWIGLVFGIALAVLAWRFLPGFWRGEKVVSDTANPFCPRWVNRNFRQAMVCGYLMLMSACWFSASELIGPPIHEPLFLASVMAPASASC
jgi:hypothetical protein